MPPSKTACDTCKQRRIKCDGDLPVCQKCIKSRRTCRGIPAGPAALTIRMENAYASGARKRPRGPRVPPPAAKSSTSERSTENGQVDTTSASTSLVSTSSRSGSSWEYSPSPRPAPSFDLETLAISFYVNVQWPPCFASPIKLGTISSLPPIPSPVASLDDDVLPMVSNPAASPMIRSALTPLSLAVFARRQNYPRAATDAVAAYQRLLHSMRGSVARQQLAAISSGGRGGEQAQVVSSGGDDDASSASHSFETQFFAIFCMARYEDTMHHPILRPSNGFRHHDGSLAVLKTWWYMRYSPRTGEGEENLNIDPLQRWQKQQEPVEDLVRHTRRSMIKSAFLRTKPLPKWLLDGADYGETDLDLQFDRIVVRLVNLRRRILDLGRDLERFSPNPSPACPSSPPYPPTSTSSPTAFTDSSPPGSTGAAGVSAALTMTGAQAAASSVEGGTNLSPKPWPSFSDFDTGSPGQEQDRRHWQRQVEAEHQNLLLIRARDATDESSRLEQALHRWRDRFAIRWPRYRHDHHQDVSSSGGLGPSHRPYYYTYPDLAHVAIWNHYYAYHMLIASTRRRALELLAEVLTRRQEPVQAEMVTKLREECLASMDESGEDMGSGLRVGLKITGLILDEDDGDDSQKQPVEIGAGGGGNGENIRGTNHTSSSSSPPPPLFSPPSPNNNPRMMASTNDNNNDDDNNNNNTHQYLRPHLQEADDFINSVLYSFHDDLAAADHPNTNTNTNITQPSSNGTATTISSTNTWDTIAVNNNNPSSGPGPRPKPSSSSSSSMVDENQQQQQQQQRQQQEQEQEQVYRANPYPLARIVWLLSITASIPDLPRRHNRLFRAALRHAGKLSSVGMFDSIDDGWFPLKD